MRLSHWREEEEEEEEEEQRVESEKDAAELLRGRGRERLK